MQAMNQGASTMKFAGNYSSPTLDDVDSEMKDIAEQMDIAMEIPSALSNSISFTSDDELQAELEMLEMEMEMDMQETVVSVTPPKAKSVASSVPIPKIDEDTELELLSREMGLLPM
jgi:hypothetical protein